jgi:hypothetical protein
MELWIVLERVGPNVPDLAVEKGRLDDSVSAILGSKHNKVRHLLGYRPTRVVLSYLRSTVRS